MNPQGDFPGSRLPEALGLLPERPASVSTGVIELTVEVLLANNAKRAFQRPAIFLVEFPDGDPPRPLAGLHGGGFQNAAPLEVIVGVIPLGEGDMILRLQAAGPVMDHFEGDHRVGVRAVLLEQETTGKGEEGRDDEQESHHRESKQLPPSRSRGIRRCGLADRVVG